LEIIKTKYPDYYEEIKSKIKSRSSLGNDLGNYDIIIDKLVSKNARVYFAITKSDIIKDAYIISGVKDY
jgi:hypothetical protein